MNTGKTSIDLARLDLMLTALRLPTMRHLAPRLAEQSDREGWPAARFLSALAEHELAEREQRRISRQTSERGETGAG